MNRAMAIAAAVLNFISGTALAMSIRFDPDTAVRELPVVAWVQIREATALTSATGDSCGVRYTAQVVSAIRGTTEGEVLSFGFFTGREVGQQFIVFLRQKPSLEPSQSSPLPSQPLMSNCWKAFPELLEVAEGLGTIPVESSPSGSQVTLDHMYHIVPLDLVPEEQLAGNVVDGYFTGAISLRASYFAARLRNRATALELSGRSGPRSRSD